MTKIKTLPEDLNITPEQRAVVEDALQDRRLTDALKHLHGILAGTEDEVQRSDLELVIHNVQSDQNRLVTELRQKYDQAVAVEDKWTLIEDLRAADASYADIGILESSLKAIKQERDREQRLLRLRSLVGPNAPADPETLEKAMHEANEWFSQLQKEDSLWENVEHLCRDLDDRYEFVKKVHQISTAETIEDFALAIENLKKLISQNVRYYVGADGHQVVATEHLYELQEKEARLLAGKSREHLEKARRNQKEGSPTSAHKELVTVGNYLKKIIGDFIAQNNVTEIEKDLREVKELVDADLKKQADAQKSYEQIANLRTSREKLLACQEIKKKWPYLEGLNSEIEELSRQVAREVSTEIIGDITQAATLMVRRDKEDRFEAAAGLLAAARKRSIEVQFRELKEFQNAVASLEKTEADLKELQAQWGEFVVRLESLGRAIKDGETEVAETLLKQFPNEQLDWVELVPLRAKLLNWQQGDTAVRELEKSYRNGNYDLVLEGIAKAPSNPPSKIAGQLQRLEAAARFKKVRSEMEAEIKKGGYGGADLKNKEALQELKILADLEPRDFLMSAADVKIFQEELASKKKEITSLNDKVVLIDRELARIKEKWQTAREYKDASALLDELEEKMGEEGAMDSLVRRVQLARLDLIKAWKADYWKKINQKNTKLAEKYSLAKELKHAFLVQDEGDKDKIELLSYEYWQSEYKSAINPKIHPSPDYSAAYLALDSLQKEAPNFVKADDKRNFADVYVKKLMQDATEMEPFEAAEKLQTAFDTDRHLHNNFDLKDAIVRYWLNAGEYDKARGFVEAVEKRYQYDMQRQVLYFFNLIEAHRLYRATDNPDYDRALQKLRLMMEEGLASDFGRKETLEKLCDDWKSGAIIELLTKADAAQRAKPVESVNYCIHVLALESGHEGAVSRLNLLQTHLPQAIYGLEMEILNVCQETATDDHLQDFINLAQEIEILERQTDQIYAACNVIINTDSDFKNKMKTLKLAGNLWSDAKQNVDKAMNFARKGLQGTWNLGPALSQLKQMNTALGSARIQAQENPVGGEQSVYNNLRINRLAATINWLQQTQLDIASIQANIQTLHDAYDRDDFTKVETQSTLIQDSINHLKSSTGGLFECSDDKIKTFDKYGVPEHARSSTHIDIDKLPWVLNRREIHGIPEHLHYAALRKQNLDTWDKSMKNTEDLIKTIKGKVGLARNSAEAGSLLNAIDILEELIGPMVIDMPDAENPAINRMRKQVILPPPFSSKCLKLVKQKVLELLEEMSFPGLAENWSAAWVEKLSEPRAENVPQDFHEFIAAWCDEVEKYCSRILKVNDPNKKDDINRMSLWERFEKLYGSNVTTKDARHGSYANSSLAEKIQKKSVFAWKNPVADTVIDTLEKDIDQAQQYDSDYQPPYSVDAIREKQSTGVDFTQRLLKFLRLD